MKNFDYGKKYHYMIKYMIMFLPLLLLVVGHFSFTDTNIINDINVYVEALFSYLRGIDMNSWYNDLLVLLGFNASSGLAYILETYPLYIIWLYLFDIVLDLFGMIPRLAHRFISKFGGDY